MKQVISFIFLLVAAPVNACVVPHMAPEYDALVNVKRIGQGTYRVSVPRFLEDNLEQAEISLGYISNSASGLLQYKQLQTTANELELKAIFTLEEHHKSPYVSVIWGHITDSLCGILAKSKILHAYQ